MVDKDQAKEALTGIREELNALEQQGKLTEQAGKKMSVTKRIQVVTD